MHNKFLFLGKTITLRKRIIFYKWGLYFFIFLWFSNVSWTTDMKPYGHWKDVCYIFYAHWFFPILFHLTIGSSLTLIQNELWVPKYCHAHSKVFFLMFRVSKKCHQDFCLLHTYYTCYTSFFWVKSGSHVVCFHPRCLCNQCGSMKMFSGIVDAMTSH
jgi:hypothetical protein